MSIDKVQTGIRFTEDMLIKLTYIAKMNYRSLNAQLEHISQKCIREYESKNGEILLSESEKNYYRK